MTFNTSYCPGISIAEPACSFTRPALIFDQVAKKLINTGVEPYYERIQSHYESTKLSTKLEQYRRGNVTALGIPSDNGYIDISNAPDNLAEVLKAGTQLRDQFERLPDAVRELFGNNFGTFSTALQDGTYYTKLNEFAKSELAKINGSNSGESNGANSGESKE